MLKWAGVHPCGNPSLMRLHFHQPRLALGIRFLKVRGDCKKVGNPSTKRKQFPLSIRKSLLLIRVRPEKRKHKRHFQFVPLFSL